MRTAEIDQFFEARFSIDEVRRFKPAPEPYALAATELGIQTEAMCLVACHVWDTLGAQLSGATSALLLRSGNAALPIAGLPQPTLVATDMHDLADKLIARWG